MAVTVTHATVTAVPDDPAYDIGSDEWNAAHTVTNALDKTGDTMTGALAIDLGTITANNPAWNITQTWNNGAVTFVGAQLAITNTASAANSSVCTMTVGGVTQFEVKNVSLFPAGQYGLGCLGIYNPANGNTGVLWNGTTIDFYSGASGKVAYVSGSGFIQTAGSFLLLTNSGQFYFGASSDAALKRVGAAIVGVTDGGSNYADLYVSTVMTNPVTVANLPTGVKGMRAFVTDATQTMTAGIGAVVAGTGANNVPVYYDGTNWRIG